MSSLAAAALLATSMRLVASHGYPDGAPPGFSGGFKEESCHACHFSSEPNLSSGRVVVDGVPARFAAGEKYTLTVTLTHPGTKRAGFQLTARFKDSGAQAGTLAPGLAEESRVGVELQGGIQYANQRKEGTSVSAPDVTRWTVEWTAPAGSAPVVFHVSANAADGDGSANGDFVHTTSVESAPPPFGVVHRRSQRAADAATVSCATRLSRSATGCAAAGTGAAGGGDAKICS